jgi:hypothetical protein
MEPDQVIERMLEELKSTLDAFGKAKTLEEKEGYSRIVKNLSEAVGVFFSAASEMMNEFEDYDEDENA